MKRILEINNQDVVRLLGNLRHLDLWIMKTNTFITARLLLVAKQKWNAWKESHYSHGWKSWSSGGDPWTDHGNQPFEEEIRKFWSRELCLTFFPTQSRSWSREGIEVCDHVLSDRNIWIMIYGCKNVSCLRSWTRSDALVCSASAKDLVTQGCCLLRQLDREYKAPRHISANS